MRPRKEVVKKMPRNYYMDRHPRPICSWSEVPVVIDTVWMARISGYTETYVRMLRRQNKIKAHKVGTEWRMDKDAFKEWLVGK